MPGSEVREQAHRLINVLPLHQVSAMVGVLESMLTPLQRALADAPSDDEPYEEVPYEAATIPHEEVLAEFGLTMEDFNRMGKEAPGTVQAA